MSGHEHEHEDGHEHEHEDGHEHEDEHGHGHEHEHGHEDGHEHEHGHGHEHEHEDGHGHEHALERGAGTGRVLFLDAFSGVAGDMLVAALLDLGVPFAPIHAALKELPLRGYSVAVVPTSRSGIAAKQLSVRVESEQPHRSWGEIRQMLVVAPLEDGVRVRALAVFEVLARAEARVHRVELDDVHFHEVGAVDSIVDTVAAAALLDWLGARIVASPLPMGRGFVRAEHGVLPLPAPATVECLRGVPTYDAGIDAELCTPTGAAIVRALAHEFSRWPPLSPLRTGWGAGSRELSDRPNLLRVVLGDPVAALTPSDATHVVVETNVDDMTPEIAAYALERVMAAGALDAWTVGAGMKKGRPALLFGALCRASDEHVVARAILTETSSIGVRVSAVRRHERPRRIVLVETPWGQVPVKIADGDGLPVNVAPEHDECRRLALAHGVPLKQVYAVVLAAALAAGSSTAPARSG